MIDGLCDACAKNGRVRYCEACAIRGDNDYIWDQAKRRLGLTDLTDAEKIALIDAGRIVVELLDSE